MKGKINKNGALSIQRKNEMVPQRCCYDQGESCSDACPLFREPRRLFTGEIELQLCDVTLRFSEFEDERTDVPSNS